MQKHSEICPKEEELDEIHHVVSCVERALKLVSDNIAEEDAAIAMNDIIKREFGNLSESDNKETTISTDQNSKDKQQTQSNASINENDSKAEDSQQFRLLKGLMRVGILAKGLLLTGDKELDLVVICAEKPSKQLLQRIVEYLPSQLQVSHHLF
jgi:zinc finger RNA-binding protein